MERILSQVKHLSTNDTSIDESTLTELHSLVKQALHGFLETKSKNEAVETINTCITKHTAIANDVIIWELANVIKGCNLNESSRIVLAFMDAPRNLKACILAKPQFIAAYSTNILQTSLSLLLDDNQTEKMGSYLLAEEGLFNGIKLSVHLLQNKGRVVVEKSFTSECSWEKNWVEKIITQLFSILASKVLQKETLSMAAIAMAHIVNHVRLEASLNLAGLILQNAGKSGDSDMGIGPITIPAWCLQRGFSELGFVAVLSSLTTVCRPEILLERAMYDGTPMADEILRHLFTCLCKTIAGAVDSEFRYYSFQALNSWLDAVSRITIEGYHSGAEREPMFVSSSYVCKQLLHLIWENREDMTDGVPKIVLSMFGKVITLNQCERALLGTTREDDQMVHSLLVRLLAEPWYIKGRYALLSEIFRHVCPDQVLQADPCYSASLCKAFSAPILVSAANECYKAFLHSNRNSTDAEFKSWNEDYWASVFQSHFLDMLTSQNTRATDNCALYFIPTTLQKIPSTFRVLKDAVLQAMGEARLTELRSSMERNRIRKNLCRAYCSIFKIGRKNGLASYQDIDFQILEECASHVSDELRAEALSVVCCNNKTTEPVSTGERLLVLEFLGNNLNCASSAFRQIVFVSIKIIMARLRDSCIMLLREYQKSRKKLERRDIFEKPPEDLISSIELVEDVFNLSIGCLFPGASFQRKKTGLQLLFAILETFSSPKDAVKRGRTAESLKTLTDWVRTTGKWNFIIERNIEILVSCFEDQHDEIRESALGLLKWFPFGSAGMTEKKASKFGTRLLSQTRSLLLSPRIRDAESGAILLEFIASRYLQWDADSVFEVKNIPDESFDEMKDPSDFSGLMHIMFSLLRAINKHIDEAYQDVLLASVQQPVFESTRHCDSWDTLREEANASNAANAVDASTTTSSDFDSIFCNAQKDRFEKNRNGDTQTESSHNHKRTSC